MDKVRCAECGYLAVRDRMSRELVEVEVGLRGKWELPRLLNSSFHKYEDFPLCLRNKAILRIEGGYRTEDVLALIQLERECDGFTEWKHGLSPKEHLEMQYAQELRQLQQEQRERDREWQERQRADQQAWQAAQEQRRLETQVAENHKNRQLHIVLALLAAALTVAGFFLGKSVR